MNINNHRLEGEGVTFHESPNHSGTFVFPLPDTIVMHYTGGGSLDGSVQWLCNPEAKASAHIVIGRDGSIVQLVPFNVIAWHAGKSTWKGRNGLNNYSIGIEMDNAGVLTKGARDYVASFGRSIPANEAVQATHRNESIPRYWHCYTEVQVNKARELCALLIHVYGIREIVGHEEIAPGRKTDPGPAFPLDKFRSTLLLDPRNGNGPHDPGATVTDQPADPVHARVIAQDGLNIREGAGPQYKTVAGPLPQGQSVIVLAQQGEWSKVRTSIEGWVNSRYLKKD